MLDQIRKSQRWLTAIFIFAIGIVFVFFLGGGASGPVRSTSSAGSEAVVELDEARILLSDFLRVREQQEQRLRGSLGDQFDADTISSFLDSQALQTVVNQMVLSESARELGLRVSPAEVKDMLRHDPSLRDDQGRFDQQNFDTNVKWTYGSQAAFLNSMQRDLLQQKLYELLVSQSHVGEAEALGAARFKTEEVKIAFVALEAGKLPEAKRPSQDDVARYFEANREALQASYDAAEDRFKSPERLQLRHILFKPSADDGKEAAANNRKRAELALARLAKGERFADLAQELSDDSVSSVNGGNLGSIERGDLAPSLEAVAFGLEAGKPSEIVEGIEGLHIVWVDEKIAAARQGFEEAGMTLAGEAAAVEAAERLARELSSAVASGQSLESAARAADLTLERTGFFARRRDGFIPDLGRPSLEIVSSAFALSLDAASSKQVFEVGEQRVLIQLLERREPEPAELEAAVSSAKETLPYRRQNTLVQAWIDDRRQEFESQQRLQVNSALLADR